MESLVDTAKLENLEQVIASASHADFDRGGALSQIRDGRLYRGRGFGNFEVYCEDVHGFSGQHAYRLIELFSVGNRLQPNGCNVFLTESFARELSRLPASDQRAAWEEVIRRSAGERLTAKFVAQVVDEMLDGEPAGNEPIIHDEPLRDVYASIDEVIADGRKFGTIYADPPWQYDNSSTRAAVENNNRGRVGSTAGYAGTLSVDELCDMPVEQAAADDAHLHLWTTTSFLPHAFRIIEAWGFEYRSELIWIKPQLGIGNYWRVSHEVLLLGIRGNAKSFAERCHQSWLSHERLKHSQKPQAFRSLVQRVSPGPYLELFGRKQIQGWTVMGNQVTPEDKRMFA